MCVQLAGTDDLEAVAVRFTARPTMSDDAEEITGKATIRPTDRAATLIATNDERRLGWMSWGWRETLTRGAVGKASAKKVDSAKPPKPTLLLHARFETAISKPMWAESFARRRCAIVARGWWEVQAQPGRARGIPYFYSAPSSPLLALAALWRREGDEIRFTMLTTAPTPELYDIHDRLPVVLNDRDLDCWLDQGSDPLHISQLAQLPGYALTTWKSQALGSIERAL